MSESDSFEVLRKAGRYNLSHLKGKKYGKGLAMDKIKSKRSKHTITKHSKKIKNLSFEF